MDRLGFVQADPIRSPARAQDLILRHRVQSYRVGDLERLYPQLGLEECFLYAYGFTSKDLWRIVHPKPAKKLTDIEREALEALRRIGPLHPKELNAQLGGGRSQNYWGGFSRTSKVVMESLHGRGVVRVSHREKGIRVYEIAEEFDQILSKEERFKEIILAALKAMGATTRKFLLSGLSHFRYLVAGSADRQKCLQGLINAGRLRVDLVDSIEYISLEEGTERRTKLNSVRLLAPFDPIVRDRTRFEHLWKWSYRFEAYTPLAKRKLGYYAMPILWRDSIVGWANANVNEGRLIVHFGCPGVRPHEQEYKHAAGNEIVRLAKFLGLREDCWEASI